jgi:two-component system cell cycle sensor histidine kinase/response regulator CckA
MKAPAKDMPDMKTVLIVDDESLVGLAIAIGLQSQGYSVLKACSADEAVRLCESRTAPVDMLITDLSMPEKNGAELADLIEARNPRVKTLFISGCDTEIVRAMTRSRPQTPLLTKPFEFERLSVMVRDALSSS